MVPDAAGAVATALTIARRTAQAAAELAMAGNGMHGGESCTQSAEKF